MQGKTKNSEQLAGMPFWQKGFTLFTALVAFILIVLAMLLTQSMVSTERSITEVITDISGQEEMVAIADLARADALQTFNYALRQDIEDFTSVKDPASAEGYIFTRTTGPENWAELQTQFAKERFGGQVIQQPGGGTNITVQLADRAAGHLMTLVETTPDARGYSITLESPEREKMVGLLQKVFQKQADTGDFFEVIGCPSPDYHNCVGTFYVTMDLSEKAVSDIDYETLPRVQVVELQTGKMLKEAILPRGKVRIYVPIRLFKAFAGAHKIAYGANGILKSDFSLSGSNRAEMEVNLRDIVESLASNAGLKAESNGFVLEKHEDAVIVDKDDKGTLDESDDTLTWSRIDVKLFFKEKNEKYMVNKNGEHVYVVKIQRHRT